MYAEDSLYNHQKVVLDIDFSGGFRGYTDITIVPTTRELKTIHLHSRQCQIHSVTVGSHSAEFAYNDPLAVFSTSGITDCHRHPELKRKLYSALAECDEGELAIAVPHQVSLKLSGASAAGLVVSEHATPEPQTPGASQPAQAHQEFASIVVHIEYSLRHPVDGIQFVLPTDAYPYRVPHMYTSPSSPDAARCWVPCIDNLWEKCTWEFEFIVPKYLEERELEPMAMDLDGEDAGNDVGQHPTVVICSGDLVEQVAHPNNSSKTIFLFSQGTLTSVQHIAFAAGPFHVFPIPVEIAGHTEESAGGQTLMHAFCLPGLETALSSSVSFLRSAMNFYSTEFGSYPFGSYKLVFVDEMPRQRFDSATLSLVTGDLLHSEDAIDEVYETRQALSHALACQWMGINILAKTWSDTWLVNGLGSYITGLFIRKLLGNNEYRFRIKKDMERVLERDNGSMPPICQSNNTEPPDASVLSFINLKAPLVLHILDRRLGKSGTTLGLSRVLPKIFLSALSGEMPHNALSTHSFLRTCRKVSGVDLRSFVDQWIYGSGCPQFSFSATFNRKKMAVEIQMRQEVPAYMVHEGDPIGMALFKPVPFFEGQMTVRIHEADGTPYEHVLDILTPIKRFEVPFNTKYKRVRRNTKRYLARQAAAQAAAEGDSEAAEAMGMVDMGFGLEIWENEDERERWKVADWTEEEEQAMAGATYEWIRMDADFEWIARIQFEQADYMWVSQLQRDRDVVAQLEAVRALARVPTPIVSSTLTKTVLVTNYYFRIRSEAAKALVTCANRRLEFIGLFHLLKLFLRYCYDPEDPDQDLFTHKFVPQPNDFSDFGEYFVRKALINAIAQVRFENGKTPAVIRQFFIDQLRYNDNTVNPYSDAYYICAMISALACATVSTVPPESGELLKTENKTDQNDEDVALMKSAIAEVERYRSMDRLIPSSHNVVTVAALEFYLLLNLASVVPPDPRIFLTSTREGNATQVRLAGFDGLFLTRWYTQKIMSYVFSIIANDPSRAVKRYVARNACESLALLASVGEIKSSSKEGENVLKEEDSSMPDKIKEAKKSEIDLMIRALRKDKEIGRSEVLRNFIVPIMLDPKADHEVRWCLLKLADLAIRGEDEPPPKVTIHLPPTPVSEVPPVLPVPIPVRSAVKPVAKPTNAVKNGQLKDSIITPTAPSVNTPKIRLSSNVSFVEPARPTALPAARKLQAIVKPAPPKPSEVAKKKEKPLPKAQSGGMSANDLKACRSALKKLMMSKHSVLFRQPVDPVRDKAPDYFEIIKSPVDLATMGAKLENGNYSSRLDFEADFRLMIQNCQTYNSQGSYAFNESVAMNTFFEKQWIRINRTLEAADKAATQQQTAAPPPPALVSPEKPEVVRPSTQVLPALKLKFGGGDTTKINPKLKQRKSKAVEEPVPYVDDGSQDLLQEVIAIEMEKGSDNRRSASSAPSSRHRRDTKDSIEDEEILNLVTDNATERPPEPVVKQDMSQSSPLKTSSSSVKRKKAAATEKAPRPGPNSNAKGKERENSTAVAILPKIRNLPPPPPPLNSSTPINEKKCKEILKNILKLPQAAIFSRPVDPVSDGCPTYYDEISEPMDFGTMKQRLDQKFYETAEQFEHDVKLVFENCRKFNPPTTDPVVWADIVEKAFKKEWARVVERKLSFQEKRTLQGIMTKLRDDSQFWVFRDPVDPVLLQIPTYFDVIPKKDARDLHTIRTKLDTDKYPSVEAWQADIELMVTNAITFNGADSEVGVLAVHLRERTKELLVASRPNGNQDQVSRGGSLKRGASDTVLKGSVTPGPNSKKAKLG